MADPSTTGPMQAADQINQSVHDDAPSTAGREFPYPGDPSAPPAASPTPGPAGPASEQTGQGQPGQGSPTDAAKTPTAVPATPPPAKTTVPNPQTPPNSTVPSGTPNAAHPAVQRAGVLNSIAQALAGGPRYKTVIDPNTGTTTHVAVPMSHADIGMAIAMEAISGALAGLGQVGPGSIGKAGAAGLMEGQKIKAQRTEAQQQADEQASQDYARQAATTQTNFQTHRNALQLGQMEFDTHQHYVDSNKEVLSSLESVGAIQDKGVREEDLLKKYNVTKDMAVADGVVPRMDPNKPGEQAKNPDGSLAWDNTYTVIDPGAKIQLDQKTAQHLADHMIPGTFTMVDGKPVARDFTGTPMMRAGMVVNGLAMANGMDLTEAGVNKQLSAISKDGTDKNQFEVNFTKALKDGTLTGKALQAFAPYSSMPLDQVAAAMEKNKVDPQLIGQIMSLIPPEAMEKIKEQRVAAEARSKAYAVIGKNNAVDVLADPTTTPEQKERAQAVLDKDSSIKAHDEQEAARIQEGRALDTARRLVPIEVNKAGQMETARVMAKKAADKIVETDAQKQAATEAPGVDGVRHNYISGFEPEEANLITAIGTGKELLSTMGLSRTGMADISAKVQTAFPGWDKSHVNAYYEARTDLTKGNAKKVTDAANAALEHLGDYYDAVKAAGWTAFMPGVSQLAKSNQAVNTVLQAHERAMTELESAYKNKALTDSDYNQAVSLMRALTPAQGLQNTRTASNLLMARYHSYDHDLANAMPSSFVDTVDPMDQAAHDAYKRMNGVDANTTAEQDVNRRNTWVGSNPNRRNNQPSTPVQQPKTDPNLARVPVGATPGRNANGQVIGYRDASGKVTQF